MIAKIRDRCMRTPFVPFSIRTSDGHEYAVPTRDYIYFPPGNQKVIVATDDGVSILQPVHISDIIEQTDGE